MSGSLPGLGHQDDVLGVDVALDEDLDVFDVGACAALIDGQAAAGQFECMWPQSYLDAAIELNMTAE